MTTDQHGTTPFDAMAWLRDAYVAYLPYLDDMDAELAALDELLEPLEPFPRAAMIDALALAVARGFVAGEFAYPFGDHVANILWAWWLGLAREEQETAPHLYPVYDGFDAGEWQREPDEDPVERHTRPILTAFLRSIDHA